MPDFTPADIIKPEIVKKLVQDDGCQSLNCYTTDRDNLNDGERRADQLVCLMMKDRQLWGKRIGR